MAVEAELGEVREVGTELDEEGAEVLILAVEVVDVDHGGGVVDPGDGAALAKAFADRARDTDLFLGDADENDSFLGFELAEMLLENVILALAFLESNQARVDGNCGKSLAGTPLYSSNNDLRATASPCAPAQCSHPPRTWLGLDVLVCNSSPDSRCLACMSIEQAISRRFQELLDLGQKVLETRQSPGRGVIMPDFVNNALFQEWSTAALAFLGRVMSKQSEYYTRFAEGIKHGYFGGAETAHAILKAAKSDFDGGYLFDTRKRIEAEVFDDFLEQAEGLLKDGYFQVAAVIAGAVLEDGLRKLCVAKSIPLAANPKLDAMNADLAKAGVYDKLVQKQVTWLADLRNKAAHGEWNKFKRDDVEAMLKSVRQFMVDYVSKP